MHLVKADEKVSPCKLSFLPDKDILGLMCPKVHGPESSDVFLLHPDIDMFLTDFG